MSRRVIALAAYGSLLVALVAVSTPRAIGDGEEYLVMGMALAELRSPALTAGQVDRYTAQLHQLGRPFQRPPFAYTRYPATGRYEMPHFWAYSALAAPALWAAGRFGVHPNHVFTLLNLCLLVGGFWVVATRAGVPLAAFLFVGPILWWADKAHTEVLTFSMLAMACAWIRDRPGLAFVALGVAAAQNPPIALLLPVAAAVVIGSPGWEKTTGGDRPARAVRARRRDPRLWLGLALGVTLAAINPLYYYLRLGIATPLVDPANTPRLPTLQEAGAVVWDPNVGLLVHLPWLPLLVLICGVLLRVRRPRGMAHPEVVFSLAAMLILLFAFSQTNNVNHGGTVGPSRYVLWLVPLVIPLARQAREAWRAGFDRSIAPLLAASVVWCLVFFRPSIPERATRPTVAARLLWERFPALHNPVPEIFAERLLGAERIALPVAARHCTKILMRDGEWPIPCVPPPVPPECAALRSLCYANLVGTRYEFAPVFTSLPLTIQSADAWSPQEAAFVRERLVATPWWTLRWTRLGSDGAAVQATEGVRQSWAMQGPGLLVLVVRGVDASASVALRTPVLMHGSIADLDTGATIATIDREASLTDAWRLPLPGPRRMALVLLSGRADER